MKANKLLLSLTLAATLNSTVGCGLLLHPERQGQRGGNLDPAIVLLDGIGLFIFKVPGLVPFVVDFVLGTIYLSGGHSGGHHLSEQLPAGRQSLDGLTAIKVQGPMTKANIEATIARELGQNVDITADTVQVQAINLLERSLPTLAAVPAAATLR